MNLDIHNVAYGSQTIDFKLRRSPCKALSIHVYPDRHVEVVAPLNAEADQIYKKVRKKAKWIKEQQFFFEQFPQKTLERQYVSGENYYYLGRQLRLKVKINIVNSVKISGGHILVSSHYPNNQKLTKQLMEDWFKVCAHRKFRERLDLCLEQFPSPENFKPKGVIVRKLEKRWGSMTPSAQLILNKALIHAPLVCIDYVIIHELCHLQHPDHSPNFWRFLTAILPDWKKRKTQLEKYRA